ncbi:MAG: pyrroline-5-carboxylate reductase [Clostridia bacterium]|nr:pyrroline-5-carboxylate reductase [Clostridia bacterium]
MRRTLGFIGGGKMATAMIKGLLHQDYPKVKILVADPDPGRRQELAVLGVTAFPDNSAAVAEAEAVILAVKPQKVEEALRGVKFRPGLPILSIVAGYSTARLEKLLPGLRILRAMPNVAALVRAGITALAPGKSAREEDLAWGKEILQAFGRVVLVEEEMMNAVTAVSGSGPGFVFSFLAALTDAGVLAGLPRALAGELAIQTLLGSAKMAAELGEHPVVLREMVTSPRGTTIAGLLELERSGFAGAIMQAVSAAKKRADELGE